MFRWIFPIVILLDACSRLSGENAVRSQEHHPASNLKSHRYFDPEARNSIGYYLQTLANRELGVSILQDIVDSSSLSDVVKVSPFSILGRISQRLSTKANSFRVYLEELGQLTNPENVEENDSTLPSSCCQAASLSDQNSRDPAKACTVISQDENAVDTTAIAAANFFQTTSPPRGTTGQFYISNAGDTHVEFPKRRICGRQADLLHRAIFVEAKHPEVKNVVVVLDRGISLTSQELEVGIAAAHFIIESLNEKDLVGLVTLDGGIVRVPLVRDGCHELQWATRLTKQGYQKHLNNLHRQNYMSSDHANGLKVAKNFAKSVRDDETTVQLFYISSAKLNHSRVFQVFEDRFSDMKTRIHFSLISVGQESGPQPVDNALLQSLKLKGFDVQLRILDSPYMLSHFLGDIFLDSEDRGQTLRSKQEMKVSSLTTKDKSASVTAFQSILAGVIGVDVDAGFFYEDLVYFSCENYQPYLLDVNTGNIMFHRQLLTSGPQNIRLDDLEGGNREQVEAIVKRILKNPTGSDGLTLSSGLRQTYYWQHVSGTPFAIVLIEIQIAGGLKRPRGLRQGPFRREHTVPVFHRLDLMPPEDQAKLCRHFDRPAILETGSVYLTEAAFQEPYNYRTNRDRIDAQDAKDIVNDLFDNQEHSFRFGLAQDQAKQDVQMLSSLTSFWRNNSFNSGLNNFIVRRYAATPMGVLYSYPGVPIIDNSADPADEPWYRLAEQMPSRVVLSRPKLDNAGYVVSLSKSVEGEASTRAVVGMDLTLGYVYKLIQEAIPECRQDAKQPTTTTPETEMKTRCFLIDHEGYIVVHPRMFQPQALSESLKAMKDLHLTQVEHLAASHILAEADLVQRKRCKSYSDQAVHHIYHFNLSASSPVAIDGEGDLQLQHVSLLPGTNVFLVTIRESVNATDVEKNVFCPCSVFGDECMACDVGGFVSVCDCPCQCPMNEATCSKTSTASPTTLLPICSGTAHQQVHRPDRDHQQQLLLSDQTLPKCFDTNCGARNSRARCFGVIECSWCDTELLTPSGQLVPLDKPFCGEKKQCYMGVIGWKDPYDVQVEKSASMSEDNSYFFRPTPSIGPIAVAIVSSILFLGLSAYCIRNNGKCRQSLQPARRQDSSLNMASFEEVLDDDNVANNDGCGGSLSKAPIIVHANAIQPQNPAATSTAAVFVSPYRVVGSSQRRPPYSSDLDHGYSTMTLGNDDIDSESVQYAESISASSCARGRQVSAIPKMTTASIVTSGVSSRGSSPTASLAPAFPAFNSIQHSSSSSSSGIMLSPGPRGATRLSKSVFNRPYHKQSEETALMSEHSGQDDDPCDKRMVIVTRAQVHNVNVES